MKTILALIITLAPFCTTGCTSASAHNGPYRPQADALRNPLEAQRLTREAASLIESDPEKAERLLRDALSHDLYHGPAHNNLGVIYLARGQLYEAAAEFEWARKLIPGHPDPRLNLGLALERAGRVDEALETYHAALVVYPGHLATIQALTRCELRHGHANGETNARLKEISMRGDHEWREWAQFQLTRRSD